MNGSESYIKSGASAIQHTVQSALFVALATFGDLAHGTVFIETGFEGSTSLPAGWAQSQISGSATWNVQQGGGTGGTNPSTARSGSNNATLYVGNTNENKTRLTSPAFDTVGYTNLSLTFWHTQALWSPDQDELKVFFSSDGGTNWTQLAYYTTSVSAWTQRTLVIPSASANSRIMFEGNAKYGYGVCLDDIQVTGIPDTISEVSVSATDASASEVGPDPGTWTITRIGNTTGALSVNYTLSGTATQGADYTAAPSSPISFAAGETSKVVTLTPIDDMVGAEGNEVATLTLTSGTGYAIGVASGSISIYDDEGYDLNILVIGSTRSFSESGESGVVHEKPFNPTTIASHLHQIIDQDPAISGSVNVGFEDIYKTKAQAVNYSGSSIHDFTSRCYSLAQHYLWPDGKANRLANLRGQAGTQWDYIIICNDPYIMANFPGMVAEGVKLIQQEVAKSPNPAQVVLLGQWPENSSTFTTTQFNEIAHRVGNSAGLTVVPAGKAWDSYSSKDTSANHPTPSGEYLAAASIYSKLYNRSAKTSAYDYPSVGDAIADHALSVVQANTGVAQYSGTYTSFNPFQMKYLTKRVVSYRETGTSTEDRMSQALDRLDDVQRITFNTSGYAGTPGTRWDFNYGRGNDWWEDDKDYEVNSTIYDWVYGFPMHHYSTTSAPITMPYGIDKHYDNGTTYEDGTDLGIPYNMIRPNTREPDWPEAVRAIPIRLMWQKMCEVSPGFNPLGDSTHMHPHLNDASAAFMYTLLSGRCPVEPEPAVATTSTPWMQWLGHKIGYETAWQMSHLTTRAPGFRVLPSATAATTVTPTTKETMTVDFLNRPQSDVTVNVSISNANAAIVGSNQLVFTPQNYNIPQNVTVAGIPGSAASEAFNVVFSTVSTDEIYNGLSDSWVYTVNRSAPVTLTRVNKTTIQTTAYQNLPVTINLNTAGASSTNTILAGPSRGAASWSGSNVIYTPGTDFTGKDGFSFATNDAGTLSVGYVEITVSAPVPNGMVSYRGNGSESGAVPFDTNSYAQNATVTVLGNTGNLTKAANAFDGWNTAADGTGTTYNAGSTFSMGAGGMILYAKWISAPTYTVTYHANSSSSGVVPSNQIKTDGVDLTLATNIGILTRNGYTFAGWNTLAAGTGTQYAAGGIYSGNANVTLYAKWTPNNYTVTFNANGGGTPSPASKVVTYASTYGDLATITYPGYIFNGWFTAITGGTKILPATTVSITANQTLFAQWTINTSYTVSYNANTADAGTVPADQTKQQDVALTLETNTGGLVRAGYTFAGWNTAADSSGTPYLAGASYTANTAVILYAQWAGPATYTISYDGNGNNGGTAPSNQTKYQAVSLALATNSGSLTKTGFSFAGWNMAMNGGGTAYAVGATYTADSAVTLYAQWNPVPVVNAGSDQAVILGASVPWSPTALGPQLWLDADDNTTITLNGASVSQWDDKSGFNRHASALTTAQPTATAAGLNGKRVVTFDGGTDVLNVDLDFMAAVSHSAFIVTKPTIYSNIYGAATANVGANSLHVGFASATTYRMNYWGNDYGPTVSANFVAGSANIMNYVWTSGSSKQILANGKSEGTPGTAGVIGTMSGGGRIGRTTNHAFFGGDIAEFIAVTGAVSASDREKMEGYLAHKWGLAGNLALGHPHKNLPPRVTGAVATLDGTATDTDALTYTWSFVSGPATATFANAAAIDTTATFTAEGVYTLRLTASDGLAQVSDDIVITVDSGGSSHPVAYNGNGSTGGSVPVDASSPYTNASTVTVLGNTGSLVRTGYTFNNWNTAAGGTGTSYAPAATFSIATPTILYAQWSPDSNAYTVTFNANGGNIPSPTSKSVTNGATYGTLASVSRNGHIFNGWFTTASGGTEVTSSTAVTITAAQTLHAQWTATSDFSKAAPDLTGSGVIAALKTDSNATPVYGDTYNLGATGLRGWIWIDRSNKGDVGLMTDPSRQILVTHCVAPASAVLALDDVILGAIAASSGTVPNFSSDCRKAFATAIGDAEKTGAGTLRVKRWRAGVVTEQNITIPILGDYNATAPFNNCPKSTAILNGVRNKMVADLIADPNYLTGGFGGSSNALALLSGVKPGDPNYSEVQTRLQTFARSLAAAGPENEGLTSWGNSYGLIYLSEYYLITTDSQVVSGIQNFTLKLAQSQSIYGTYGHGAAATLPDGSGKLYSTGYGPVNAAGGTAAIALVLGKKALIAAGQSIDPKIDAAIQRSSNFFAFFVNKGAIPYGEHEPVITSHASNSKDATPAVFFALQSGRATEAEYFSRISVAGWIGREYGHTGQALGYYWATLGALMGGPEAASEHLKQVRWHLDLSRRTDGSFTYDGQEQYGPGSTSTYLGPVEYGGMLPNAIYLLTYSLPLQRLYITGKDANQTYTLSSAKVASAVAAGSFRLESGTKSISELFTAIGDYDPIVRNYASIELASRTPSGTDLTNLHSLLSSPNPNLRQSACQTLGLLQDGTALPTIVTLLNDSDIWVRAKAAVAISTYSSATASTYRNAMMTSFIANHTDPDIINWNDPLQMANGKLSNVIFGQGVQDGTAKNHIADYTINADKQTLLYPALRAALKHPDSYMRTGATQFCKDRLPLADAQAVYPEAAKAAEFDTPADRMWSGSCRHDAITMLANMKIAEGIPLALAMLESAPGFEWGEGHPRTGALNALATYGDAARYTLPTLKAYLNQWSPTADEYPVLVSTIAAIENAITAPAQELGLCVANPQVVTTTGAKALTLSGASPRGAFTYINVTQPAHGTVTGTAPNLTYTPTGGYTGPDQFTFQTTDTMTTSTVATVGIVVGSSGNGVNGDYFNNMDFTSLARTRIDPQINFDWGTGPPDALVGPDTFSVRWSGVLLVPQSGNYTFSSLTSDGVRLYINGQLVMDRFVDQSTRWTDSSTVYLTAGQYADIYMEYYENTGSAVAKLKWTGPGFAGANGNFIPQSYLFDGSGMSNRPAYAFSQSLTTNLNTAVPVTLNGSGGTLTYMVLTQPTNGVLSGSAPNLTYTPNTNFSGTDSFTFLVNNGTNNSLPATVSINVQAGPLTSFTWTTPVSGNWSDATKWTPGLPAAAGLPTYALNFTSAGTYTATHNLNNNFQLTQLNTTANVTLAGTQSISFVSNGGSLPQFNQDGGDTVTVNHPLSLQAMTTLGGNGGGRVTLNGVISGTGGLIKNNPGILQIGQLTNSYSGGTVLNAGTVEAPPGDGNLTPVLGSGTITFNQSAVLSVNRTNLANNIIFNSGTVTGGNSFSSVFSGSITLNGVATFDFGTSGGFEISGNISGPGGFTYTGPFNAWSELPCSGTNTYTGPTTILSGTLSFPSINSVPPGPMILSVDSKLKLNFTGTRVIESFTLNGVLMPPGTYGSTTSSASNKNDTHFTGNGTITVLQPTNTVLSLTSGSSPANPGTSLTFTAAVSGSTPTGNVQFYSGTTLLGTSSLNGSYQAILTTNQLAVGSNNITARYVGNASNSPSTSSPVVVVINSAPAAAPAFLNATPADPSINLNWTASPGATHYYVKRSLINGGPYTVIAYLTGTSYTDSAILNATSYYYVVSALNAAGEGANSSQATANIGSLTATTTTLTSSPVATGVYGTSVTFTATVTATNGTPTGTVTFRSGAISIGTGTLSAGTATLAITTLSATTHSITASYAGSLDSSSSSILSYQITQKPITLSGVTAANKVYDGNTTATLSGGSLSGIVGGDIVTIVPGTGTFANSNTGTWAVTATGYSLGGAHAANYSLSAQPTVPNATITARPIHITGTKTYDATTAAPNSILTIANNVDGGNLSLVGNATLATKDAGAQSIASIFATPIRVQSAKGNTGTNANTNLSVALTSTPLTGNTLVAVVSTRGTTANRVSGITGGGVTWSRVSQATNANGTTTEIWVGPNVVTGTTAISITQASLRSAAVVMEYSGLVTSSSFDQLASNTGNSTGPNTGTTPTTSQAGELWIGGIGIASSTPTLSSITNSFIAVDNAVTTSTTAGNNARIYALERMVSSTGTASSGGTITTAQWSGAIATFKAAPALSLTGSSATNYTLTGMTSSVTVTPKDLTVSGLSASNRAYNGTTVASLTGTPALLAAQAAGAGTTADGKPYTGDTITLGGSPTGGSFATKHVGTNKPVTGVTGLSLSGAQSGNYTLVPLASLAANVTQLSITAAAVTATKTYDGTTAAPGTPTLTPALASGDTTTVLSQSYQTTIAGTSNKTLVPAITIDDGNGGNNYAVTLTNFTTGTITQKSITVAAVNATKTYDGTTTAPGTPTITPALASGDTTSALSQSYATATAGINNKVIIPAITINDGNSGNNYAVGFTNFTTGTINKATATVTLGDLSQTFTNTPKSVSVTTTPLGLANAVTYDGSSTEPTNAGTYAVVATVNDTNYAGSGSASLVIAKANQTITFAALDPVLENSAPFTLGATASSNLPVSYTSSNISTATVSGNTVTIVGIGSTTITASQAGGTNYNPATSIPRTLTVSQQAPLTLANSYLTSLDIASPTNLFASLNFPSFLDGPFTGASNLTFTGYFGGQLSLVNNAGNTFDGNIHVNGGTLRIAGNPFAAVGSQTGFTAPSMTSSDTFTLRTGGTLTIDDNALTGGYVANRFGSGVQRPAVSLAGGVLILNGLNNASSSVQNLGALTVSSGQARIDVTRNGNGNPTLNFASLAISKGAVANFSNTALGTGTNDPRVIFASTPTLTNGIIAGAKVWAYDAGNGAFATYGASGVTAFTAYDVVSSDINTGTSSTTNFAMTAATTPATLTADRAVNSLNYRANGGTWSLGGFKLTLGSGMFLRNGTNNALTINNGTLTAGNGTDDIDLHIFTAQQNMTIDAVIADNAASAVTLVKSHGNQLTVSGTANNTYTGGTYVVDGSLVLGSVANRTYLGTGKAVVDGNGYLQLGNVGATSNATGDDYTVQNGGKIQIASGTSGVYTNADTFHIAANSIIAGGSASGQGLASLTRGTNITLASGAIIGQSALTAALNTTTGTIQNLGTVADLYYGLNADQNNANGSINIGSGTAFRGISTDRSGRSWQQGTINIASGTTSVDFQGHATHGAAAVLTLGNGATAGNPVINFAGSGTVDINAIGALTLNDDAAAYGNQNVRFVAKAGSALTVTPATGMGSGTGIASAVVQLGGSLAIGNAAALNGAVTVEAGGRLVANQATGLAGLGGLAFTAGSILEITNATGFSGAQATAASIAAGTIVRLNANPGAAGDTLDSYLSTDSPIYQIVNDVTMVNPTVAGTTILTLNKTSGGVGGILTNSFASKTFGNSVNGKITLGANGGVMAGTTNTELVVPENIDGAGTLTIGTTAIIDGAPKLGSVGLGSAVGSNTYTGGTIIHAGTLRTGYADVLGVLTNPLTVNTGGTLNMTGGNQTVGNLTGTGGVINAASRTLTIGQGDNGGGNFQGSIQGASAALTKTGTGTITLSGTNSYTGATLINVGTLIINGNQSTATGNVTVAANATLGGTGTIGGSTTILTGGKLAFNISTAAAGHDRLDISSGKSFAFSGASELTITSSGGMAAGLYTLITGGNTITGVAPTTVNMPAGWSATASISGNSLLLNVIHLVDHFAISAISSPQTIGTPITGISMTAQDIANQTVTSFTGTVTFGGTAGITGTSASFVAGVLSGVSVTPSLAGAGRTLTVNDGFGHAGSATFTVLSLYATWANGYLPGANVSDPTGNNDGDSLTNLQEYAFGTNPTVSDSAPIAYTPGGNVTTPGAPVPLNLAVGGGVDYRAVFGRRKNHVAARLTYTVQFSADFTTWANSSANPTVLTGSENSSEVEAVSVPYPLFISTASGYQKPTFFRVRVSSN